MKTMTSRERALAAIYHQNTDRVPVDYCTRDDVARKLMTYLGVPDTESLYQKLGIDWRKLVVAENHPKYNARINGTVGGRKCIAHDERTYENAWGVVQRISDNGLYNEWVTGPFANNMDLDSFDWPDMSVFESVESLKSRIDKYEKKYAIHGVLNYPFKTCWAMRGLENFLCDMMIEPDFARELMLKAAEYEIEKGLRFIRAGADLLGLSGDTAMQDRMLVNVEAWREIDKPILANMIKIFKNENPDIIIYYHSDGNMEEIMNDMIEVGVQVFNPIQPEAMDVVKIKKLYGDRITMHGTISIQQTLPHGTVEDVRKEVQHRIENCGQNGGLILAPSNHVQNDTPLENVVEIYKAAGSYVE